MGRTRTVGKVEPVQKRWLSKEEAMNYLGVGEDFLRTLREAAELSYSKFGNKIWYDLVSIDRFILRNKVV